MRLKLKTAVCLLFLVAVATEGQKAESLLIGPGDLLHVQVYNTPALEQHSRVNDAGELPLFLGGNVKVAGLTPEQASQALQRAFVDRNLLLNPRVLVSVEEYATEKVTVIGEVHAPGSYATFTPRSVLQVLSLAGGLTDMADRKVLIERSGSTERIPYFVSNKPDLTPGDGDDLAVNPGDTVVVPKAGIVYILGDVKLPGGYTMTNNEAELTVLQLVARAGGTNNTAVPSHAKLIRISGKTYDQIPLPLSAMQKGNHSDLPLRPGDIVYVPFSYLRNFAVTGAASISSSVASAAVYRF
jgi:polysaccharide biosynthesis/export protein